MPNRMKYRQTEDRGFTLVEILVAVALIGIVVSIVYGSLAATTRSARIYGDRLSASMKSHLALQQIAATLRCCSKELRTPNSELRMVSSRPLLEEADVYAGPVEVALRHDRIHRILLVRQQSWRPGPDRDTLIQAWIPLLEGITNLRWSFWDGSDWVAHWDSTTQKGLPLRVRIEMDLEDDQHRSYQIQTTVSPMMAEGAAKP